MWDMNIINSKQAIEQWESDFILTGDESHIPEEDRLRVLHEIDVLYEELCTVMRLMGESRE